MEGSVRGGRMGGGGSGGGGAEALPLPPPPRLAAVSSSSPASIRALLARTTASGGGGGVDCQSPRSLLSRILLRGGGGDGGGGGGGGFGCRVRLPRRYGSSSGAGGGREEIKKDGAAEQQADAAATPRLKLVERAPELPADTPRSSLGKKRPEEEVMSMNLGLGASLVLLLSKSAVELNKMVELRAQMEALVSEIRHETKTLGKEKEKEIKNSAPAAAAAASSSSSSSSCQESNAAATTTVIKDPIARATSVDVDALSNCSRTAPAADHRGAGGAGVVMDRMEAELQIELNRMQMRRRAVQGHGHDQKRVAPVQMQGFELPLLQVKTKSVVSDDGSPSRSCVMDADGGGGVVAEGGGNAELEEHQVVDDDEGEEEYEEHEHDDDDDEDDEEEEEEEEEHDDGVVDNGRSPPHGGVSARALERRLHELLQRRQQDRIVQLESALDSAQRRLQEREREVVWWRDAAKLVSHRRDESRRLR